MVETLFEFLDAGLRRWSLRVEISGSWLGKGVRFYMFVLSFEIFSAWCFFSLMFL